MPDKKENKLYDTGENKWRYGTIVSWHPNRNPERWLLGPCPRCGSSTSNYGGSYSCHKPYCPNNSGIFVCSPDKTPDWWDGDIDLKLDGNSWCAYGPDFINLQESIAGFGDTPNLAVEDYRRQLGS